jgi:hypothetical protein
MSQFAVMFSSYGLDGEGIGILFPAVVRDLFFSTAPRQALEPTMLHMKKISGPLSVDVKR